jgi:hypothetical protein
MVLPVRLNDYQAAVIRPQRFSLPDKSVSLGSRVNLGACLRIPAHRLIRAPNTLSNQTVIAPFSTQKTQVNARKTGLPAAYRTAEFATRQTVAASGRNAAGRSTMRTAIRNRGRGERKISGFRRGARPGTLAGTGARLTARTPLCPLAALAREAHHAVRGARPRCPAAGPAEPSIPCR